MWDIIVYFLKLISIVVENYSYSNKYYSCFNSKKKKKEKKIVAFYMFWQFLGLSIYMTLSKFVRTGDDNVLSIIIIININLSFNIIVFPVIVI